MATAVRFSKRFHYSPNGKKTIAAAPGDVVVFDETDPAHPNAERNARVAVEEGFGEVVNEDEAQSGEPDAPKGKGKGKK